MQTVYVLCGGNCLFSTKHFHFKAAQGFFDGPLRWLSEKCYGKNSTPLLTVWCHDKENIILSSSNLLFKAQCFFWIKNLRYLKGALPTVINYIFRTISVWHCLSSFPSFRKNNLKNNIVYPLFYNRKKKCHLLGLRNIRHSQNIGAILVALCLNDVTPRQKIKSTRLHVFLNVLLKRKKKKKKRSSLTPQHVDMMTWFVVEVNFFPQQALWCFHH